MDPLAMSNAPNALQALNQWAPVVWLKVNPYAYPMLEVVHILGLALVFGTLWIVDLHILGALRVLDVQQVARQILPWTLAGFALSAASGLVMFTTAVGDLIANPAFVLKMALLFVAGTNAAMLHARGALDTRSRLTRAQALFSIIIWVAVITCGRWIGYL
ncbi:MAG: hypothetical protein LH632_13130 [Rhodoferax sp.]|nr:hypothetical protein [Rhodoferax sp.]